MGFLLVLTVALILYGTLYPFDFGVQKGSVFALLQMSLGGHVGFGDVISNVMLFLPFGFFAMQSVLMRAPRAARLIFVVVLGAAFSFGIESIQSYLPERVTDIYDIATDTAGTLLGAVLGWKDWRRELSRLRLDNRPVEMFPILLFCAWLGNRLFPFVPTIDVQNVKNALKPLFFGDFSPLSALNRSVITMVVYQLAVTIAPPGRIRIGLTLLPLGVIAIEPFIVGGLISRAEIVGTLVGMTIWWGILSRIGRNAGILALLLASQIVLQGLTPFAFNSNPGHFSFIPFAGFMAGSMSNGALWVMEKIFVYGSLVWLTVKAGRSLPFSLVCGVVLLTGTKLAQIFVPGRVSEITDPLMAVILGLVLYFLDIRGTHYPTYPENKPEDKWGVQPGRHR